jgi:metal-responsive CopG/Arc/MetJ family transcriptional regulator
MAMTRTNVTLPEEMIREIDELAGPRGRSAYVAEAVRARLKRDRMRRVFRENFGATRGTSEWRSSDEVYRWVRSLREGPQRDDDLWDPKP